MLLIILLHGCFCSQYMLGFPSTSFVVTDELELKSIAEVEVGDRLKMIDEEGKLISDPVVALLITDPDVVESFMSIKLLSGETIEARPKQLVFEFTGQGLTASKFAKDLKPGSLLISLSSDLVNIVAQISIVKRRGVFLPLTQSGKLFVNGVLVSCYGLIRTDIIQGTFYKYYLKSLEYLPTWMLKWTDYQIANKHWSFFLIEKLMNWVEQAKTIVS